MPLVPAHGHRVLLWLVPVLAILLVAVIWLWGERTPEVGKAPQVSAEEAKPAAPENPQAEIPLPSVLRPEVAPPKPWQAPTRVQLVQQLEGFFGQPWEEKSKVPFTADEFCDLELQMKLFDLGHQLGIALNAGVDLRNLEAYGIVLNADGSIRINNDAHPRWTMVYAALVFFRTDSRTDLLKKLRDQGFSKAEVKGVEERAALWPRSIIRSRDTQLMRQFVNDIQTGSLSAEAEIQRAHELTYQSNKNMIEVGTKWAIGILAPLDTTKREVLVKLALEGSSSHTTITPGPNRDEAVREGIVAARSGDLPREYEAPPAEKENRPNIIDRSRGLLNEAALILSTRAAGR